MSVVKVGWLVWLSCAVHASQPYSPSMRRDMTEPSGCNDHPDVKGTGVNALAGKSHLFENVVTIRRHIAAAIRVQSHIHPLRQHVARERREGGLISKAEVQAGPRLRLRTKMHRGGVWQGD